MTTFPEAAVMLEDEIRPLPRNPEAQASILRGLKTPIWVFDIDKKRISWANTAAIELWRSESEAELLGRDLGADMSPTVNRRLLQYKEDFIRSDARFSELWILYPKEHPVSMSVEFSGFVLSDGRMGMLCEAHAQIDQAPETVRSVDALLHTSVMITLMDQSGIPIYRNPAARASVVSSSHALQERFVRHDDFIAMTKAIEKSGEFRFVAEVSVADGTRWHEITASRCRDAVTGRAAILISEVDVSDLRRAEEKASFLAYRDPLTQLSNRAQLLEEGQTRLSACAANSCQRQALLFIDLDKFKHINDSLGHSVGDQVLTEIALRLRKATRRDDLIGRLGGDEFIVLARRLGDNLSAEEIAERILHAITKPLIVNGIALQITCSIGFCLFPDHAETMAELIENADIAMYSAKRLGRNRIIAYSPSMAEEARARLDLEINLRKAVARKDFMVFFQPRLHVETGAIVGAEALVRWKHPTRGMIPPSVFIPVCEEIGIIQALSLHVFEQAVRQQVRWKHQGYHLKIAINLSAKELETAAHIEHLQRILNDYEAAPADFEIEITESALVSDNQMTLDTLFRVRECGLSIAIDDFGTGYSNLAYMQKYPIDCLKIDRSFIRDMKSHSAIAELIIAMCKLLNLRIVAEGVETEEQLAWLKSRGCQEYQGFLFSPPVSASEFQALIEKEGQRTQMIVTAPLRVAHCA